ncbi:hypothetical protein GCM10023116_10600 [Kistimonas scapharcae]|uniref:Uncharacterized protein n=1 Tax=Kistimonas scapharcae TaxID=1036133 RepID=A0ABP8UYV0_9GAMM
MTLASLTDASVIFYSVNFINGIDVSDIEIRLKRSMRALLDSQSPKHKRLAKGIKAYNKLDLNSITAEVRSLIESTMASSNDILGKYDIETFDDYRKISNSDLNFMIETHIKLCNDIKSELQHT